MPRKSGSLAWEQKDRLGILTITGAPSNLIPEPDFVEIEALKSWIEAEDVGGIIITGEGRHFSSGGSLENFTDIHKYSQGFAAGRAVLDYIENLEKPVIACINGVCFGAGLEIALACHLRYCSKNTLFSLPEIIHGLIPGLGGVERLLKIAGRAITLEILLRGDTFDAGDAYRSGLVNGVVEGNVVAYGCDLLEQILAKGAKPVAYTIRAVNNAGRMDLPAAIKYECAMFAELLMDLHTLKRSENQ